MMIKKTRDIARLMKIGPRYIRDHFRISFYNIGYKFAGSLDGYPHPPADLVNLVIGTRELAWHQLGGLFMHQAITTILRRHGVAVESLRSILDFGCGCGRILRWWASIRKSVEIWGSDYNPKLIDWCKKNLSDIAKFTVNGADPPLAFPDGKFEFIYAYSVFTHLSKDRQQPWMKELVRVLQPKGFLLITTHGKRVAWRSGFSDESFQQLEDQGVLVFGEEKSGSNMCATYHSESYLSDKHHLGLDLIDFMAGGARDSSEQDIFLYRKETDDAQAY